MAVAPILLSLAMSIGGQTAPSASPPIDHVMYDDSGKGWKSPDPVKLLEYVRKRNAEIKAGPKGGVDKEHPPMQSAVKPVNYGVDHKKVPKVKNARRWGSPGAYGDGELASEGGRQGRLHVTAIGPDADRVVAEWRADPVFAALEESMGDSLAIQAFVDPSNPMVADVGLPDGGTPDVVIQTETGKVVYRARHDPGAAVIVGEVRKRRPEYDPRMDPGSTGGDMAKLAIWGGVALAAYLLIRGQNR